MQERPHVGARGRRLAVVVLALYFGLLTVATTTREAIERVLVIHANGHRRVILDNRWQIRFDGAGPERWAQKWRREHRLVLQLRRQLARYQPHVSYVLHRAGWLCIHGREGPWNAQTGNGYYGGLQMSYGWAGRVTNAALLSPDAQIAAADAEAREHGYSYGWMQGQWPNTFPPCAAMFR